MQLGHIQAVKGLLAKPPLIRIVTLVDALVLQQVAGISETLQTDGAFEGFLAGMDQVVALKVGGLAEALVTQLAGEGFQARMDDRMLPQVGRVVEALLAFRTLVKFLTHWSKLQVDDPMAFKFLLG